MKKIIGLLFVFLLISGVNKASASDFIDSLNIKKKEEQSMKAMQEVCDFLKKCGVYFIATVDGDQPRVRPFGTAAIFENRLYIQTGKKKRVSKQMKANPKI
ncbi:MAG: pyridoxamine 5'-phosphate oxidase family protein, partial [Dysgonamonadaceae bacterium]|nr:pyridoxamine 5'-phosphate oxidase family protein [Dysgonamonadaceae bacterium]